MSGVFVTATDTGVGKTFTASRLAEALRRTVRSVGVFKPFASGGWEDTEALIRASGSGLDRRTVTPVYFPKTLAPALKFGLGKKSRTVGRAALKRVLDAHRRLSARFGDIVIEGSGGALVPLWKDFFITDLAARLRRPLWVVARPGLGTLNHTLLTVEALRRRRLDVRRIVVSGYRGATEAERTNPGLLRRLTGLPVTVLGWTRDHRKVQATLLKAYREDFQ